MGWTDRPDGKAVCPGTLGAVRDTEQVARLFVVQYPDEGYRWLVRSDLLPPTRGPASDECGEADGLSVDRCSALAKAELIARSGRRAAEKNADRAKRGKPPNQFPGGARIASVERLRALGEASQVMFVYDDARDRNAEHAVVRLSGAVPEEEVAGLLDDVASCFDTVVP